MKTDIRLDDFIIPFSSLGYCKGYLEGSIFDFERCKIYNIPNFIIENIFERKSKYHELIELCSNESDVEHLNNIINELINKELVFIAEYFENFIDIEREVISPNLIDLILIEIDYDIDKKIMFLEKNIERLGLVHIVLISRCSNDFMISYLNRFLRLIENSKIQHLSLFCEFRFNFIDDLLALFDKYFRFRDVVFYSFNDENDKVASDCFIYQKSSLVDLLSRNIFSMKDLSLDLYSYLDSFKHNIFYNRRLYIDNLSYIKHNIDTTIYQVDLMSDNFLNELEALGYNDLWLIKKDNIEICKDCQYKRICPDSRIPNINQNIISHDKACKFDPYTNTWT